MMLRSYCPECILLGLRGVQGAFLVLIICAALVRLCQKTFTLFYCSPGFGRVGDRHGWGLKQGLLFFGKAPSCSSSPIELPPRKVAASCSVTACEHWGNGAPPSKATSPGRGNDGSPPFRDGRLGWSAMTEGVLTAGPDSQPTSTLEPRGK